MCISTERPIEWAVKGNETNGEFFALTDREAEVLSWIAKGKSSRDIATILTCSPRTITKHLEQVYHKLQVENRTTAAMRAIHVLIEN
jgi:DNA-binding CsgD family transcriptional regulator